MLHWVILYIDTPLIYMPGDQFYLSHQIASHESTRHPFPNSLLFLSCVSLSHSSSLFLSVFLESISHKNRRNDALGGPVLTLTWMFSHKYFEEFADTLLTNPLAKPHPTFSTTRSDGLHWLPLHSYGAYAGSATDGRVICNVLFCHLCLILYIPSSSPCPF